MPAIIFSKFNNLLATYFFFISSNIGLKIPSISIYKLVYSLLIDFFNSSANVFISNNFSLSVSLINDVGWIMSESVSP